MKSIFSERYKEFLILFLLIILGTLLRFAYLDAEDIWLDEIFSIEIARQSLLKMLPDVFEHDVFPLYNSLLHFSIKIFGENPISVRFPALLSGILAIPAIYLLGKKLFNIQSAIWISFLITISPYHVYYSQESRTYTLQVLLIIMTIYYFVCFIENNKSSNLLLYLFFAILATFAHWYSIIIIITLNIFFLALWLFQKKKQMDFTNWILSHFIYLMTIVPWIIVYFRYEPWTRTQWIPPVSYWNLIETFYNFSSSLTELDIPKIIIIAGSLIFGILTLMFFYKLFKNKLYTDYKYFLSIAVFLLPIIIFYFYSLFKPSYVAWRYLIIALPGFYLITGTGLSFISNQYNKIIMVILISVVYGYSIYHDYTTPTKISLRKPTEYISQEFQPDDAIVVIPFFWERSLTYYYPDVKNIVSLYGTIYYEGGSKEIADKYSRVWLIEVPPYYEPFPLDYFFEKKEFVLYTPARNVRLHLYSEPKSGSMNK